MCDGPIQQQKSVVQSKEDEMYRRMQASEAMYQTTKVQDPVKAAKIADHLFEGKKTYSSMSKSEKKMVKSEHSALKAQNTFIRQSQVESPYVKHVLESDVEAYGMKMKQQELFDKVRAGDCSYLQKLDAVLRNRAATEYMEKQETQRDLAGTPEEVLARFMQKDNPVSAMMNPLLRIGISCVMNAPDTDQFPPEVKEKYRKIDALFNQQIMVATISKIRGQQHADLTMGYTPEDWARNTQSQKFIFKTMLAAQLGKMRMKNTHTDPPVDKAWEGPVANAFAHCSRVMITLPGDEAGHYDEKKQKKMFGSFHGKAGFFSRGGATHTMSRKKKGSASGAVEKKFFSPRSQYGMNIAVGGLGNPGIPDAYGSRYLKNDGSCGHLFMHFEEGTKDKHAGMLLGFESDAYGTRNQTGHVHDLKATGEFASSFGGQRCDEIGDKYGGRTVDLSGCSVSTFTSIMEIADHAIQKLIENQGVIGDISLEALSQKVCGNLMSDDELKDLIRTLQRVPGSPLMLNPDTVLTDLRTPDRGGIL